MPLNKDNFLRWEGVFTPSPFTISGSGVTSSNFYASDEFIIISPFVLCSCAASAGIDFTSFRIITIKDTVTGDILLTEEPCSYDSDTQLLTVFRPIDYTGTLFEILFSFKDVLGNELVGFDTGLGSTENCLFINISPVFTEWIPYPISAVCVLDNFGVNTGYKAWSQLQLINMSSGLPIIPLTLKDNLQGDPDYYSPVQDYTTCAPGGSALYAPLIISNFSQNPADVGNFITITQIFLSSSNMGGIGGGLPLSLTIPCYIPPGKSVRFMIPESYLGHTYDGGITLTYTVTGDMVAASPLRFWSQNTAGVIAALGGGGIGTVPVDNSGAINSTPFTIGDSGITIFAQ